MEIVIFVGARPGYIKSWSVYKAFTQHGIFPTVVATGQHHDILKQHQEIFLMPVDHWLITEQPHYDLADLYGQIYNKSFKYLKEHCPKAVFVNGDTTSALAAAQAAFHLNIPVAHIESGLRSFDLENPYPEEFNRITIDALSTWLFPPTALAERNCRLINSHASSVITGNTVIDALMEGLKLLPQNEITYASKYLLIDLHRRELSANALSEIMEKIFLAAKDHDYMVIWPAHPNPKIQAEAMKWKDNDTFLIIEPQNYLQFIRLMRDADLILTDSGGVVEEAITLGTPTLQIRKATDRQEAILHQCSWLTGLDADEVYRFLIGAIQYAEEWHKWIERVKNPYGNGHAGEKIVKSFLGRLSHGK